MKIRKAGDTSSVFDSIFQTAQGSSVQEQKAKANASMQLAIESAQNFMKATEGIQNIAPSFAGPKGILALLQAGQARQVLPMLDFFEKIINTLDLATRKKLVPLLEDFADKVNNAADAAAYIGFQGRY